MTIEYSPDDLAPLSRALTTLHQLYPEQPIHRIMMLLLVAEHPGATTRQLVEWTKLAPSSVNRGLSELSDQGRTHPVTKQPTTGLGLVMLVPDPQETRRHSVFLSQKGNALIRTLKQCMAGKH